jgi:hypothetical protein
VTGSSLVQWSPTKCLNKIKKPHNLEYLSPQKYQMVDVGLGCNAVWIRAITYCLRLQGGSEGGSSMFLRNVSICLRVHTVLQL